jgi:hypothetical protein
MEQLCQRLELPRVLRQRRHGIKRQNDDVANHSSADYLATKPTRSGILLLREISYEIKTRKNSDQGAKAAIIDKAVSRTNPKKKTKPSEALAISCSARR